MSLREFDHVATCIGALLLVFVAVFWVFVLLAGCTPALPEAKLPSYCFAAADGTTPELTRLLNGCATVAPTPDADDDCRRTVLAACGIAWTRTRSKP